MPPVARIGKPGIALAMADTALRAMGLMALPANIDHVALVGRSCRTYKYFNTGILIYVNGYYHYLHLTPVGSYTFTLDVDLMGTCPNI